MGWINKTPMCSIWKYAIYYSSNKGKDKPPGSSLQIISNRILLCTVSVHVVFVQVAHTEIRLRERQKVHTAGASSGSVTGERNS